MRKLAIRGARWLIYRSKVARWFDSEHHARKDAGWEMPVQSRPVTRSTSARLSDAVHVLGALAAALLPLIVFAVLSYHQTLRRAEADLTQTVEMARRVVQDLLHQAELELTRFVQVTDGRVSRDQAAARDRLYQPLFPRSRDHRRKGFLVHSTAAEIETPIAIPADQRADPRRQIDADRRPRANLDHAREIDRPAAFDPGPGAGVNVLVDPGLLALLFRDVELGPGGNLLVVGPGRRALNVQSPLGDDRRCGPRRPTM